jgi:hypothetical protein
MELDASLPWLALALTSGLAARLSARLLRKFGSPERIFHASLTELESCSLPALVAQSIFKQEAVKRAEKELAGIEISPDASRLTGRNRSIHSGCCRFMIRRCCFICGGTHRF